MKGASDKWVTVGVVGSPHGVKGAVHVNTALTQPLDLGTYSPLTLSDGRVLEIASVKPDKGAKVIASFEGIATRDQAQALTHEQLRVPRGRLPKLGAEDFYHADLIGLQVLKISGEKLGQVVAVRNFGAGDVLEIKVGNDTQMVALTRQFVPEIDLEKQTIVIGDEAIS